MRKQTVGLAFGLLGMIGAAFAQTPPAMPKPGPEHKAMAYFAGKWATESDMKPGPMGPGGKITSKDTCEWFTGGFHLVCKGEGKSPMGPLSSYGIMGYNAEQKAYTYYAIDNMGTGELSTGQKSGNTWTFSATSSMGGQSFKSRYTIVETSPTAYTFKWEMSQDGTQWSTLMEGKSTKVTS